MAVSLDEIDVRLLRELEADADRPNVELARLVSLSPAATLNRVRRLKESGVIRRIGARLDSAAAGFTLQVYVTITLARQDEAAHRRFQQVVEETGQVISADWVTGETDALLMIVARDVAELQLVLSRLTTRGGAQRMITLLRLEELKPSSPLPLRPTSGQRARWRVQRVLTPADQLPMDITGVASLTIQANTLHAVRTTLSAAQAAPQTPDAQAAVILQLSTAAQQLMQGGGTGSHPSA